MNKILSHLLDILMIAVALLLQTYLILSIVYVWMRKWKQPLSIAAPGGMIGASNFFELAVAISLFGLSPGTALASVVGVLVEVPVMLSLVTYANRTRQQFAVENMA